MQPREVVPTGLTWGWVLPAAMLLLPVRALAATLTPTGAIVPELLPWGLPFAAVLASLALGPMLAPRAWHRLSGPVMGVFSLALLLAVAWAQGLDAAGSALAHAILDQYLPFMSLLFALYTIGGGILVTGGPWGRPAGNTLLLTIGTVLAGFLGTTAVAMVLIHPLLRANGYRRRQAHLVIYFILLVANAGGALSPIGDPPLYVGFLLGVPFFWPLRWLAVPLLLLAVPTLASFYLLDRHLAAAEPAPPRPEVLRFRGGVNLGLICLVAVSAAALGAWNPGVLTLAGHRMELDRLAVIVLCLAVSAISIAITPKAVRRANMFSWGPIREVAEVFVAIFITIGPVLTMLSAGAAGPLAGLLGLVTNGTGEPVPAAFFWLTGLLSSLLDNAPTYIVFFGLAGGDAQRLSGPLAEVLIAISTGAVFFGGLTYIGNAPNLMVRAVAAHRGVRMPGFFGYSALAALVLAGPLLIVTWVVF
ncbi:MAG: sodium:proton antiporter [Acetobacteraceae bacterium]